MFHIANSYFFKAQFSMSKLLTLQYSFVWMIMQTLYHFPFDFFQSYFFKTAENITSFKNNSEVLDSSMASLRLFDQKIQLTKRVKQQVASN
jgi:hypothetical protein